MTHTPGPWTAHIDDERWVAPPDANAPVICDLQPRDADVFTEEDDANARLIAAAPEMLTALKETLAYWDTTGFSECDEGCDCIVQSVQAAIAKAEGRS